MRLQQAHPAERDELLRHQHAKERRWIQRTLIIVHRRQQLVYTRARVLDMTRRRALKQPMVEEIVGRIGGARAW